MTTNAEHQARYRDRAKAKTASLEDELRDTKLALARAEGANEELRRENAELKKRAARDDRRVTNFARSAQKSMTKYALAVDRDKDRAVLIDRIVALENALRSSQAAERVLRSLVIPPELVRYAKNKFHSDRELFEKSKPKADELFKYLTKHLEIVTLEEQHPRGPNGHK